MIKISCHFILGLIGSLTIRIPSSAKQINIQFDNGKSFYTSPVVYLTGVDGQFPKIAIKDGMPTTGGVDAKEDNFTDFVSVTFDINRKMDNSTLKLISHSLNEKDTFCKKIILSLEGNKIL